MTNIRLVARFHYGNAIVTVDKIAPHCLDVLDALDVNEHARNEISKALQRPNDVHRALRVESGWWTICQVWERDQRSANEILSDARRHNNPAVGHTVTRWGVYAFSCGYGCQCGAFPLDANYNQNLATDG